MSGQVDILIDPESMEVEPEGFENVMDVDEPVYAEEEMDVDEEEFDAFNMILDKRYDNAVDFTCFKGTVSKYLHARIMYKYHNSYNNIFDMSLEEIPQMKHEIYENYMRCKTNNKLLTIMYTPTSYHMNALIFNTFIGVIEHYEPYGKYGVDLKLTADALKEIVDYFDTKGEKIVHYTDYSFNACPYIPGEGIQQREEMTPYNISKEVVQELKKTYTDPIGFCCMWSLLLLEFRYLYPKEPIHKYAERLRKRFAKWNPFRIKSFIRGYTKDFVDELRSILEEMNPEIEYIPMDNFADVDKMFIHEYFELLNRRLILDEGMKEDEKYTKYIVVDIGKYDIDNYNIFQTYVAPFTEIYIKSIEMCFPNIEEGTNMSELVNKHFEQKDTRFIVLLDKYKTPHTICFIHDRGDRIDVDTLCNMRTSRENHSEAIISYITKIYNNKPIYVVANSINIVNALLQGENSPTLDALQKLGYQQVEPDSFSFKLLEPVRQRYMEENPDSLYLSKNGSAKIHIRAEDLEKDWYLVFA